ncbi:unnamed protein product [Camellia sinensis]
MEKRMWFLIIGVLVTCLCIQVRSDASDHRYQSSDPVPLYSNKVGPFHNPSETYRYFDLPFCFPDHMKEKKEALGEVLNGDRLVSAPYTLDFLVDKDSEVVCRKRLTKEEVSQFRTAVLKDYYFQMYYDDLPIWGFMGKVDREGRSDPNDYKYFLFKHIHFDILYNKDRVIEVNARMDPHSVVDLTEDKEVDVEFTYTVKWKETNIPFENRMEKFSQTSSLPHHLEIHWFSIVNSCVTVLLLTGFLATILMRVLKNDFIRYAHDEESADDQEETGWKYIHGDVFRFPKHKSLFAAALGSGTQLFTLTVFIFLLALVGVFYPYNRGALFTALVVIYALTSGIAGYVATSFYCQLEGTNWVRNLLLTGSLFCGSTAALPFGTIVVIVLIWMLVTSPLLVLGGIAGKNSKTDFQAPCRTTKYPREIPQLPWYRSTVPQMAMAGFLPFSAIYIELYYIFASVWGHRIYTIYSILFILAAEDHEWWWRKEEMGETKPKASGVWPTVKPFVNGGASGMLATCVIQPIDMIKVRIQLGQGSATDVTKNMFKNEGIGPFYKGLTAGLLRQATYTTARLGSFRILTNKAIEANDGKPLPLYQKALCGLTAGAIGASVGSPADLALIRMQADATLPLAQRRNYTNAFHALYRIVADEGVLALWKGAGPTVVRAMALNMGMLASYDQSVEFFKDSVGFGEAATILGASSVSGFFAAACSLPFDYVKTQIQKMQPDAEESFLCGGSTGLFIYGYSLYYYHARSDMSGFMQTSFFFGYMACICYGFFLMLGAVGFRAALLFVRHIYRSIKCE